MSRTPFHRGSLFFLLLTGWAFIACAAEQSVPGIPSSFQGLTTFIPRSQGANTARELVGLQRQYFRCFDDNYAVISSTIAYSRSFNTECLAQKMFSTNCLRFQGSQARNRVNTSIVADYFGLPTDFDGTLSIDPVIQNVAIDLGMYFGLDTWARGLYVRINAPIVHTKWDLGLDECAPCTPKFRGCTQFPACYMFTCDPSPIQDGSCGATPFFPPGCPRGTPILNDVNLNERNPAPCPTNTKLNLPRRQKNGDCTTQCLQQALSGEFTFGDMTEPWEFGKFAFCPRSKTGLADLDISVGWNPLENDYAHAGIYIVTVFPTGTRPKGKYIFEPIVGSGRHWKFGGGLSAHRSLYPYEDDSLFNAGVYIEARAVTMARTDQVRSFDFKQMPGGQNPLLTRYILLKEYDTSRNYSGVMVNAINFATRNCEVAVGLMADISIKTFMSVNNWLFDLGYNFYYRSAESICLKTECPCSIDSRLFAIKGLEGVCCQPYVVRNGLVTVPPAGERMDPTPSNAFQNNSTMFDVELPSDAPTDTDGMMCLSWNSRVPECPDPEQECEIPFAEFTLANGFVGVPNPTIEPQLISCADLDPSSAAQGTMKTHKIFGHICYTFEDSAYCPNVGIGAEGEFDACSNNALEQWSIWLKGGVTF